MLRKWTDSEVARLKDMMQDGCPSSEIAAALGRTEKAVEGKRSALRHPRQRTSQYATTRKIELTPRQESWLIRHFKHTKNDVIMAKLGLSHSTLHRFARELGLSKTRQFIAKTQRECAASAQESHIANGTYPPKGYIIPRSEEFRFQKGVTPEMRLGKKRNEERIRKSAESRRKTVAAEKRRALFGLPQKTKLKIGFNRKKILYRHALRKLGYIIEHGSSDAYVTESTNRSELIEQRAAKHGIHVITNGNLSKK